jgi:hypothetical protein
MTEVAHFLTGFHARFGDAPVFKRTFFKELSPRYSEERIFLTIDPIGSGLHDQ